MQLVLRSEEKAAVISQAHHFQSLLRPEEVEHGLQMLLDVVALALLPPARFLGLRCRKHQSRTLSREVTFAEAETNHLPSQHQPQLVLV